MEDEEGLRHCRRWKETRKRGNQMHCGGLDLTLEQRKGRRLPIKEKLVRSECSLWVS